MANMTQKERSPSGLPSLEFHFSQNRTCLSQYLKRQYQNISAKASLPRELTTIYQTKFLRRGASAAGSAT